jgi:hypothetical protein
MSRIADTRQQVSRRLDRLSAGLWFLLAALSFVMGTVGRHGARRGCARFHRRCFYVASASPVFFVVALVAVAAAWWLWSNSGSVNTSARATERDGQRF